MSLIVTSKFFQDRSSLINDLNKCAKGKICRKTTDLICCIWRSICEFFRPKVYQKKLNKKLEEIKNQLAVDRYQRKIERFYKKFVQEAKKEAFSQILNQRQPGELHELEKHFQMPLDTQESIHEFSHKLERCFGFPLQGKLLLLSDCFEWKDKMSRQRQEAFSYVKGAKVKSSSYNKVSQMIKKAKQLVLLQAKDVKSYSHFMREFSSSLSEATIKEASFAALKLDQEKNKALEKYQEKKKKIQEHIAKLKKNSQPSMFRLKDLNEKLKFKRKQLKATEEAFSDLYGEWLKGMNEIKTSMSSRICSENPELLAFWKKKLQDLLKSKAHLDLFIEMFVRLDRICLCLKSANDLNGIKLVTSGLSIDLKRAATAFVSDANKLRELIDTPKHIHDQITGVLDRVIADRMSRLESKVKQPLLLSQEEKIILELEEAGLRRQNVSIGANSLFDSCVKGIQAMEEVAPEFKAMDGVRFRKALYEHMKSHRIDYVKALIEEISGHFFQAAFLSDELFVVRKSIMPPVLHTKYEEFRELVLALKQDLQMESIMDDLNAWLVIEGVHSYLDSMGACNAYPGIVEIEAVSKMLKVPIRVYSDSYNTQYRDIGEYPMERSKALHLLQLNDNPPHFEVMIP